MKQFLTFFVGCLLFGTVSAQQQIFQKHLGSAGADYMTDMQQLPDGSFVTLGYTKQGDSTYTQFFKTDSLMNVVWSRTFSFNNQMKPTEITRTVDNGYIIAGRTWQTPQAATKEGGFVIKTDSTGVKQWQRIIKYDGSENVVKVTQEADSTYRYFVTSRISSYYIKADKLGVPTTQGVNITNGGEDFVMRKVVKISAERFAILGAYPTSSDYIVMMNRDTIQWAREYSGILNVGRFFDLTADAAGNLFFTGDYMAGNYGLRQIHVGKLTQTGLVRWTMALPLIRNGGLGIDTIWRFSVGNNIRLVGKRVLVSGSLLNEQKMYSVGTLTAVDTTLPTVGGKNWLWTRTYGQNTGTTVDSFVKVFPLSNGQILNAGRTGLDGNVNKSNFYFVKTDSSGTSSCNYGSYTPVEQVTNTAFLAIAVVNIGLSNPLINMATYTDVLPTSINAPLGTTATLCNATMCAAGTVTAAITPLVACANDTLTVTASGATSYFWNSTTGLAASRTDSSFRVPVTTGAHGFTLTAQPRGNNCFFAQTFNVTANPLPNTGLSVPRLMCLGDSLSVASGAQGNLTFSSSTNTPYRQVSLSQNGGSVMVTPTTFGVHVINLRVQNPTTLCVSTNSTTLTVRENVVPTVDFTATGCPGPELTLRAVSTNGGTGTISAPFPEFMWIVEGQLVGGRQELTLPNAVGKRVQVIMNAGLDVCPAPPGTRQVSSPVRVVECRVGTGEIAHLQNLSVYPNPTNGHLFVKIELDAPKMASFRVLNLLGQAVQVVKARQISAGESIESFDLTNMPAGIYMVETKLDNQTVTTKIQVQ
jgi:uncharacterized membrane protein